MSNFELNVNEEEQLLLLAKSPGNWDCWRYNFLCDASAMNALIRKDLVELKGLEINHGVRLTLEGKCKA